MGTNFETISNLFRFFNDSDHVDVKFLVKCGHIWTPFYAHKLVLSLWSSVFAAKVSTVGCDIEENAIEITDIPPTAFKALLKFLYGSSEDIKENEGNVKFILSVYHAAKKYKINELENFCWKKLNTSSPNKNNVFAYLEAATLAESESLIGKCYKIIQMKTEEVLISQGLENMTTNMILTMLQQPYLSFSSEYELLKFIYDWGEYMFSENKDGKSHKEIIQPFLPYMNFIALQPKEFAALINKHKMFFDEKESFHIFMNIFFSGSFPLPSWFKQSETIRQYKKQIFCEKVTLNPSVECKAMHDFSSQTSEDHSIIDEINNDISSEVDVSKNGVLECGNGYTFDNNHTKADFVPEDTKKSSGDKKLNPTSSEKELKITESNTYLKATSNNESSDNQVKSNSDVGNAQSAMIEEDSTILINGNTPALSSAFMDNNQTKADFVPEDTKKSSADKKLNTTSPEKELKTTGSNNYLEETSDHESSNNQVKSNSDVENAPSATTEDDSMILINGTTPDNIQIDAHSDTKNDSSSVDDNNDQLTMKSQQLFSRKEPGFEILSNNASDFQEQQNMLINAFNNINNFSFGCQQKSSFEELKESSVSRKGIRRKKFNKFYREYKSLPCTSSRGFIEDTPFFSVGGNLWNLHISKKAPRLEEIVQML